MRQFAIAIAIVGLLGASTRAAETGNAGRGQQLFRACAACHSLVPGENMTGPSLAGMVGRKAGTLASFPRYSPALKAANVIWDDKALDAWLTKPDEFIPGTRMIFQGIGQAPIRADIIAYLKQAA